MYAYAIIASMQPEFSPQARGGEQYPSPQAHSYEVPPNFASPEMMPGQTYEQLPSPERSPIDLAPPPPMAAPPLAPQPAAAAPVQPVLDDSGVNPVLANDDDEIEKEWVDRAKQVISQTRDDPRAREKAIGALQRDYLMKRYGKDLGATSD